MTDQFDLPKDVQDVIDKHFWTFYKEDKIVTDPIKTAIEAIGEITAFDRYSFQKKREAITALRSYQERVVGREEIEQAFRSVNVDETSSSSEWIKMGLDAIHALQLRKPEVTPIMDKVHEVVDPYAMLLARQGNGE